MNARALTLGAVVQFRARARRHVVQAIEAGSARIAVCTKHGVPVFPEQVQTVPVSDLSIPTRRAFGRSGAL